MNKKLILGIIPSLLLAGLVGCSNDSQNSNKKMNNQKSSNKMHMTDKQMKNMKKNNKK
ncbi:MAG: hypothetical protein Q8934_20495 [Bacillota bacterium]|nr:hypothetical protein [Bacillota bacterium]